MGCVDVVLLYSHTVSTIPGHRQSSTCAEVFSPERPVSPGNVCASAPLPPPPCPRCGRDHKPNGLFTLVVWFFCIPPTTWAPCTAVDTRCEFSCLTFLSYTSSTVSRARLPPTFWLSARHLCCFSPPPKNKIIMCTPQVCYQHLFSLNHSTTLSFNPILPNPLLPNPCCAPYILPLGHTPITHPPPLTLVSTLTSYP